LFVILSVSFPPKSALGNLVARSDGTRFGDYKDDRNKDDRNKDDRTKDDRKEKVIFRDLTWLWEM
jgi:hypothetical protein